MKPSMACDGGGDLLAGEAGVGRGAMRTTGWKGPWIDLYNFRGYL